MSGVVNSLVAAKFLFAAKIMIIPYNNNSNAYIIATLLCGERKFAATSKPPKDSIEVYCLEIVCGLSGSLSALFGLSCLFLRSCGVCFCPDF